jgi:pimeloyl-ACP methyl ester carboxylesterase
VIEPGSSSDHITPYDRLALDEGVIVALLAAPAPNEGLVEYFGAELHAELVRLARQTVAHPPGAGARRVYVLPGIMGSQLGMVRGGGKPNDILWLDPIDFQLGRLTDLKLTADSRVIALGAMNYSYLKLTLSLRAAGFDAVLLDYDWRRDVVTLGKLLAERIAADGRDDVALVGHSMGGLVARGALAQPAGRHVSRVVMLGTPNSGSFGAVQALRGTYSVVRKLAQLDLRHDAEFLAREVFSTFPGLHELMPAPAEGDLDLFDPAAWPAEGPGPDRALLRAAARLGARIAGGDARCHVVVGCNYATATGIALQGAEFEYEYSRRGDGTVPIALARLPGADHGYIDCDHSDLPRDDRVIAGTIDLLGNGVTQRFAAEPPALDGTTARFRDAELRALHQDKVDWPHMTPAERRQFLDNLNEAPRGALVPP